MAHADICLSHEFCDWFHFERSRNELDARRLVCAWFRHLIDGDDVTGILPDDFRRQVYNAEAGRRAAKFRIGPTFISAWLAFSVATMLRGECAWHLCLELIEGETWGNAPDWWPAVLEPGRRARPSAFRCLDRRFPPVCP